jgi:uncharacterized protein (DUF58 family)
VTREGRAYLLLTFGVGFAAVNTGNNLLFLSLGVLLSLILLSGILSESALRGLSVRLRPPLELRAGQATWLALEVRNANRIFPSVGVRAELEADAFLESAPAHLFFLPAGHSQTLRLRGTPARRGLLEVREVRLSTRYPFGIFLKTRRLEVHAALLAWPARARPDRPQAEAQGWQERGLARRRGGGDELHALRPYRQGDEARHIHWRRSLRVGRLLLAEREHPGGRLVRLRLALGPEAEKAYEAAISTLGSTAEVALARGDVVRVEGPGLCLPPLAGPGARRTLLAALARLPPAEGGAP